MSVLSSKGLETPTLLKLENKEIHSAIVFKQWWKPTKEIICKQWSVAHTGDVKQPIPAPVIQKQLFGLKALLAQSTLQLRQSPHSSKLNVFIPFITWKSLHKECYTKVNHTQNITKNLVHTPKFFQSTNLMMIMFWQLLVANQMYPTVKNSSSPRVSAKSEIPPLCT